MLVENINIYAKEITKFQIFKSALKPLQKVLPFISITGRWALFSLSLLME